MRSKKRAMKREFEITFQYGNRNAPARVIKSVAGKEIQYIIYPLSPYIIREFGAKLTLFKEDDNFSITTSEDPAYKDYVNKIAAAIQDQDPEDYS